MSDVRNSIQITIDIDWADDEWIRYMANILSSNGIRTTWFVTHDSKAIRDLKKYDCFELGIHPNFKVGSTQGENPHEIMENLLSIVPGANCVRTHDLGGSLSLLNMMADNYDILYDLSVFLPYTEHITPHTVNFGKGVSIVRIPYYWQDDFELRCIPEDGILNVFQMSEGLKVFNFHPVHTFYNFRNFDHYLEFKSAQKEGRHYNRYSSYNIGILTYLRCLIDFVRNPLFSNETLTISEVVEEMGL